MPVYSHPFVSVGEDLHLDHHDQENEKEKEKDIKGKGKGKILHVFPFRSGPAAPAVRCNNGYIDLITTPLELARGF